jgi:hypothetical protein
VTQNFTTTITSTVTQTVTTTVPGPTTTVTTTVTAPPPPPPPAPEFGIAPGSSDFGTSDTDLASERDAYGLIHAKWDRFDIYWSSIETAKGFYNWSSADRIANADLARGIKVIGTIAYTPSWARPANCTASDKCAPANVQDYADFAYAAAQHFAAMGIHYFEIWNEPNIHAFWQPTPSASAYTALLNAAYPRIKAADPQAVVLSGGLSPQGGYNDADCNGIGDGGSTADGSTNPVNFVQQMYTAGAQGHFDELGFHPYGDSADTGPCSAWAQMSTTATNLRGLMVANGDSAKDIDATEAGNCVCWTGVTEQVQADRLTAAFAKWKTYSWAHVLTYFYYHDTSCCTGFGLTRSDFSHRLAWAAYQAAAA